MRYILASASPRRKEILSAAGLEFQVVTADADETSDIADPVELTKELARRKGAATAELLRAKGEMDDAVIISADTVVVCDGKILGKPRDRADAERMLRLLSGRMHAVVSGVALTMGDVTVTDASVTYVTFDTLDDGFLEYYLNSDEPYDKAGAYGIQGKASAIVKKIDGCYFGVVGLPVNCLRELAKKNNIPLFN